MTEQRYHPSVTAIPSNWEFRPLMSYEGLADDLPWFYTLGKFGDNYAIKKIEADCYLGLEDREFCILQNLGNRVIELSHTKIGKLAKQLGYYSRHGVSGDDFSEIVLFPSADSLNTDLDNFYKAHYQHSKFGPIPPVEFVEYDKASGLISVAENIKLLADGRVPFNNHSNLDKLRHDVTEKVPGYAKFPPLLMTIIRRKIQILTEQGANEYYMTGDLPTGEMFDLFTSVEQIAYDLSASRQRVTEDTKNIVIDIIRSEKEFKKLKPKAILDDFSRHIGDLYSNAANSDYLQSHHLSLF